MTTTTQWSGRSLWVLGLLAVVSLACTECLVAGEGAARSRPHIMETDVRPHSRPMTFSQLLDEYVAMVQATLRQRTATVQEPALVEVKLTVRKDGVVTFGEVVVLEGPTALREELLPLVNQLGPLPPPPVDADLLDLSVLLPLQYPGPDLLDSIEPESRER